MDPLMARFSMWAGSQIGAWESVRDIRDAIRSSRPPSLSRYALEWIVKAGEGGTWQGAWDRSTMAVTDLDGFLRLWEAGMRLRPRLYVTPYVNLRGRDEWREEEMEMMAALAARTGRLVLNLEPGEHFWNGPTDPQGVERYLQELEARAVNTAIDLRSPSASPAHLQLAAIPRWSAVDALGGAATFHTWLNHMRSAAWECYGATADDLRVEQAIPRVNSFLPGDPCRWSAHYRIPIIEWVEHAEGAWAGWAQPGLQVWHMRGPFE